MTKRSTALFLTLFASPIFVAGACGFGEADDDSDSRSCTTIETAADLDDDGLPGDDGCYSITGVLTVDDGDLVLEGDTTLYFDADAGLSIEGDGRLTIRGTDDDFIELRGDRSERGFWRGIRLRSPGPHTIDQARIAEAGAGIWDAQNSRHHGGLVIADDASAQITETLFENHTRAAVVGDGPGAEVLVSGSRFDNNDAPMLLEADHLAGLASDLSFNDNRTPAIRIDSEAPATRDGEWANLDVPYLFEEVVDVEATVGIAPGTRLEFDRHAGFDVDGGQLIAEASFEEPILFVGENDISGFWRGLRFRNAPSADDKSRLEHVAVLHAGSERWIYEWSNSQANILVHEGGHLAIDHARIAESDWHGISIRDAVVEGCDDIDFDYDTIHRHHEHTYSDDEDCY